MERRGTRSAGTLLLVAALLIVPLWALSTPARGSVLLSGLLALAALPAAYLLDRGGWLTARRLPLLLAAALVAGIFSILTGDRNGLTDEPSTTALYRSLYPNLYGHALGALSYTQYGRPVLLAPTYYVYMPLLTWLTIPGVDYRWVSLLAWLGTVVWLRDRPFAAAALGAPYVAVLAGNGFNDFVPLLLMTVAFAGGRGAAGKLAMLVSLGAKQFCGVIALAYYALRREWGWAAVSVVGSVAFLLPFLLLSPSGTYCHAVLANPLPCDQSGSVLQSRFSSPHLNYWLYPLWAAALFGGTAVAWLRAGAPGGRRARLCAVLGGRQPATASNDL